MFISHKNFYTPKDETVIWHYFSLSKFIGILETSELFFSRQDQFDDVKEGHLSQADKRFLGVYPGSISEYMESDFFGCYYANCWTISESDEYVLWNTYASLKDGIAIKSTVGNIKNSLDKDDDRSFYIAKVQYYDELSGSTFAASGGVVNILSLAFSKRKYFNAEKELRLLYHDNDALLNDEFPKSVSFRVNLRELIDAIYVAPKSYIWFKDAIVHLVGLYGLSNIEVNKSNI